MNYLALLSIRFYSLENIHAPLCPIIGGFVELSRLEQYMQYDKSLSLQSKLKKQLHVRFYKKDFWNEVR